MWTEETESRFLTNLDRPRTSLCIKRKRPSVLPRGEMGICRQTSAALSLLPFALWLFLNICRERERADKRSGPSHWLGHCNSFWGKVYSFYEGRICCQCGSYLLYGKNSSIPGTNSIGPWMDGSKNMAPVGRCDGVFVQM